MRVSRSQNVMREVLAFLLRHWRREAWLVTGVACSMVVATIADLFMPVFAGRMVDAVAMHAGNHQQALHAALSALVTMLLSGLSSRTRLLRLAMATIPACRTISPKAAARELGLSMIAIMANLTPTHRFGPFVATTPPMGL